jgi:uncharacterized protein YeaO (DUF488 family)
MNKAEKEILKQFEQENIIANLARYELCYQIALEVLVQQTEFDEASALEKLQTMQLEIEPEHLFYTVIALIRSRKSFKNFKETFEKEIQQHACINALEDYLKNDTQLLHPEMFLEQTIENINNNTFFNARMQKIFEEEYDNELIRWKSIITKELASEIKQTAVSLI